MDTGLQWKSIKGKGEIESCLAGQCLCQVIMMVLMVMVVMVNGDGVDGTDDGDVDYHQLDNHQGEHADCRGRSLTLVPATTEGRIIKSLSVLSDDGRDDDFIFSLLMIIKMVVVIATKERVIKNLLILDVYRIR